MNFDELVKVRYSVRAYQAKPVEEEKINKILEAAVLAPTAVNKQPFQIIVVHTSQNKEGLARIYHREWFIQAPLIICVCALPLQGFVRKSDGMNYAWVDASIVMTHIILAATEQGLGTCWIANFDAANARQVLELPDNVDPVSFTPLGYAADEAKPKVRKAVGELVRYEKW